MKYDSIADIYTANERIREELIDALSDITPSEASVAAQGDNWSLQQIAEHISMVDNGIARICGSLLEKARSSGKMPDGSFSLSSSFGELANGLAVKKLEAPDRVQPTGTIPINESLERMAASTKALDALRGDLERYDLSEHVFPHPYFGNLSAAEWLALAGLHERRHKDQIMRLKMKIRNEKAPG
ncbi:MAG: DinB family protein [Pyrinomonadaceae bacterium]